MSTSFRIWYHLKLLSASASSLASSNWMGIQALLRLQGSSPWGGLSFLSHVRGSVIELSSSLSTLPLIHPNWERLTPKWVLMSPPSWTYCNPFVSPWCIRNINNYIYIYIEVLASLSDDVNLLGDSVDTIKKKHKL
jgi:hypothetical protein